MEHSHKVERIARQVRQSNGNGNGQPLRVVKASVPHTVPNPRDPLATLPKIDASGLDAILSVDPEARLCTAESGVTFKELVEATLEHGLIPKTVPELEGITVGGAVSGCSIESMSHRFGGFHDSCTAYELVTGTGDVFTCARDDKASLFHMLHGSYGTLGILTQLTFELIPARPYVRMENQLFDDFDTFWTALRQAADGGEHDFVDAIVHGPRQLVLCLGTMVDEAPYTSRYDRTGIYYRSTLERRDDYLALTDYFFRYDADCHWLTRTIPPLELKPVRALLGGVFLGSTNLIRWAKRLRPILGLKRRPEVVVDVFVPERRFTDFWHWYVDSFDFFPLWLVPYRVSKPYPWLSDEWAEGFGGELFIDAAVYGKANSRADVDYSELLEKKVVELNGIKTLISRNHFDEKTFWQVYSRERYQQAKAALDPDNRLGDLYGKYGQRC